MMRREEVILRVYSGQLKWIQAAEILKMSPRTLRRWKKRYETQGIPGLIDTRFCRPSKKRAPAAEVEKILRLYQEKYAGFNVRHFTEQVQKHHGVKLSYSFIKGALQTAGLVSKGKRRGRHHQRREPKASFGEMLHLDGSLHPWLALKPQEKQTLIAVVDDATKKLLYAQLHPTESSETVMRALKEVVETYGIPMRLYTDRASWAFLTPIAGGKVDKTQPTQVGRVLERLGIEHIAAYSPQARGRSERVNRTLQDRLVQELKLKKTKTVKSANRYLSDTFIPDYNARFGIEPRSKASVFVRPGRANLHQIFSFEYGRIVASDNTVHIDSLKLQIPKQCGRASCARMRVTVRKHLDGAYTVMHKSKRLGRFDAQGRILTQREFGFGLRPQPNSLENQESSLESWSNS